jgi:hypothetical protein
VVLDPGANARVWEIESPTLIEQASVAGADEHPIDEERQIVWEGKACGR